MALMICPECGGQVSDKAHAPNEMTWKQDLVTCAAVYAAAPALYKGKGDEDVCEYRGGKTNNDIK